LVFPSALSWFGQGSAWTRENFGARQSNEIKAPLSREKTWKTEGKLKCDGWEGAWGSVDSWFGGTARPAPSSTPLGLGSWSQSPAVSNDPVSAKHHLSHIKLMMLI
jgi:hypothetical protein